MALLELADVRAGYGQHAVLQGIDLVVEDGEVVALLGANGAGKTTTLRAISGLIPRTGRLDFDGHSLLKCGPAEAARLGIAHVPEGRGILGELTVLENLRLGAYLRRDRQVRADLERVLESLPRLAERRLQLAATLSGGEQQQLAVARALLARPKLVLVDEPSLGLAPQMIQTVFDLLGRLNREAGTAILLVEQNVSAALGLARRAYVLEAGQLLFSGSSAEVAHHPELRRAYLGEQRGAG